MGYSESKDRVDAAMAGFAEETDAAFRKVGAALSAKPELPPAAPRVDRTAQARRKAVDASRNGFPGVGPSL